MLCADTALKGIRLYDGTGSPGIEDALLLVAEGRVAYAGGRDSAPPWEARETLEASGATVLPGLMDLHVHALQDERALESFLSSGVTTVRDLACEPFRALEMRAKERVEGRPWPRLFAAGPVLTCPGGYPANVWGPSNALTVRGRHQAAEGARRVAGMGFDAVKIGLESELGPCLSLTEVRAVVKAAHDEGRRVVVHLTAERDLELALQGGVDELAHLPARPVSDELWREVARRRIPVIPTLHAHAGWAREWRRREGHAFGRACRHGFAEGHRQVLANLERFLSLGGRIVYGTDAGNPHMPFGASVEEWRDLRKCGLSAGALLRAACADAAEVLGRAGEIGVLTPGARADFAVYASDPLKAPENLRTVRVVYKEGVSYPAGEIAYPPPFDLDYWIAQWEKTKFEEKPPPLEP